MDERRELWWPTPSADLARVVQVPRPLECVLGGRLDGFQVAYEAWGTLDAARSNAVLVVHPLAMDAHATGEHLGQPLGWWDGLIGPGRGLDTERFFVVCPNLVGSCYGSTGPRFPAADGKPWLERFPLLTPRDLMRAQASFVRELGIERLHTVIGPSMGGMIAWEWALEDAGVGVGRVVVVASPPVTTAKQVALNWLQRRAIEQDDVPLARAVGMVSYRAAGGLDERFGRGFFKAAGSTLGEPGLFNVESWLSHHGRKAAKRFDPQSYRLLARAMDLHDVGRDRGGLDAALAGARVPVLAVGIDSDELYPAAEVRSGIEALVRQGREGAYREIHSAHGHDGFLLETGQLAEMIA